MPDAHRRLSGEVWAAGAPEFLDALIDEATKPVEYGQAMLALGRVLGDGFCASMAPRDKSVLLVTTVEDADYLARGFSQALIDAGATTYLACLWIDRSSYEFDEKVDVANIIGEFVEPLPGPVDHMVVMKSIISGTCVVRTSLQSMLEEVEATTIHVAAPVILEGAERRLEQEFPAELARRFRYWFLAQDDLKNERNEVVPGVGGNVYMRLGFVDQKSKNAYMPKFVLERISGKPKPEPESSLGYA